MNIGNYAVTKKTNWIVGKNICEHERNVSWNECVNMIRWLKCVHDTLSYDSNNLTYHSFDAQQSDNNDVTIWETWPTFVV